MSEVVTLDLKVKAETDLAVMVTNLQDENVWLPLSQVEVDYKDQEIQVPEWLAIDKDLV